MRDIETLFEENNIEALKKKSYYELLNASRDLNQNVFEDRVKHTYRQLSLRFHPDRTQGDAIKSEIFKLINDAQETLLDSVKRRRYDAQLDGNPLSSNTPTFFRPDFQAMSSEMKEVMRRIAEEIAKEVQNDRRQWEAEEATAERVVKAYVIKGGTSVERQARIREIQEQHYGITTVGLKCVAHSVFFERKEAVFSSEFGYHHGCDYGDYLECSFTAIIFANARICKYWSDSDRENFIRQVASMQGNVETLEVREESRCVLQ